MASGILTVTLLYGYDLKDKDLFGKQDPYCKLTVGGRTIRSRTHKDGGKNPVWNQTFTFNVVSENSLILEVYDEDTFSRDDLIGRASVDLAAVKSMRKQHVGAPLMTTKGKQKGSINLDLSFEPAGAGLPMPQKTSMPAASGAPPAAVMGHPPPGYPSQAPAGPAAYPYPPAGYPSQGAPQAAYAGAPPPGYPAAPPGYPPAASGSHSYSHPSAPPPGYPPAASGGYSYTAGYPPAGYPPAPGGYYPPPGHHGPHGHYPHGHKPPKPHHQSGMGAAGGALAGLAGGLLLGGLLDAAF